MTKEDLNLENYSVDDENMAKITGAEEIASIHSGKSEHHTILGNPESTGKGSRNPIF